MIKILLHTTDDLLFEDLSDALQQAGFWFEHFSDISSLKKLQPDSYDMILLHAKNKLELAELINLPKFKIPVVGLIPADLMKNEMKNLQLNSYLETIILPIATSEFVLRLRNMVKNLDYYQRKYIIPGTSGSLKDFTFLDVLQAFMRKKYTGRLLFREKEYEGYILFYEGEVVDAMSEPYSGLEAIDALIFLDKADFEFITDDFKPEKKIKMDANTLLFHLLEYYSEIESILPQLPDRYTPLIKNSSMKNEISYLSDDLQQLYHKLPDMFNLMYIVFHEDFENKIDAFEKLVQLIRQEYIIEKQSESEESRRSSGLKKLLSRFFGRQEEEQSDYEQFDQLFPDEYLKKRRLMIQLNRKDIKQLEQLIR